MSPKGRKNISQMVEAAPAAPISIPADVSKPVLDGSGRLESSGPANCEMNPRHRKLKKQLEQIKLIEEKQAQGGELNDDQLVKLSKKDTILAELQGLSTIEPSAPHPPSRNEQVEVSAPRSLSLDEQVEAALATPTAISDHVICLDRASERNFRGDMKSLRELRKLQTATALDKMQREKLERLLEELPSTLQQVCSRLEQLREIQSSGKYDLKSILHERQQAQAVSVNAKQEKQEAKVVPATKPAIGVDAGGVLTMTLNDKFTDDEWHTKQDLEVPGAMRGLKRLVGKFGASNVHVVSKCSGIMRKRTEEWLLKTMDITKTTGVPEKNIHFCHDRTGPDGKGVWAQYLKLTHFIDDRPDCLWSVYFDEHGNCQNEVKSRNGKLYYFRRSGVPSPVCKAFSRGQCSWGDTCKYAHGNEVSACHPHWPKDLAKPDCVVPIDDWDHIEALLHDM